MHEDFGDWGALLDQAQAASVEMAKLLRRYYRALREEGFTPSEALLLTDSYGRGLMETPIGEDDE